MKNKTWLLPILLSVLFIAVIACAVVYVKSTDTVSYKYHRGEELIDEEEYSQALRFLEPLDWDYMDTKGLVFYCYAQNYYDEDDIEKAYEYMEDASFSHQPDERLARIEKFRGKVEKEYKKLLEKREEQYQKWLKKEEAAEKTAKKKKKSSEDEEVDVPYVGMWESDIYDTSIGDLRCRTFETDEYIDGKMREVTYYNFYEGYYIVFVAKCVDNRVVEVSDNREDVSKRKKKKKKAYYPEVDEYKDTGADEFYDYFPDDFLDYEDAEEYYYEHGGN